MAKGTSLRSSVFLTHWLPVLVWMGLIFFLSHQDKDGTVKTSGFVLWLFSFLPIDPEYIKTDTFKIFVRKTAHFTEYLILYLLSFRLVRWYQSWGRALVYALVICILYALTDEYHQTFVPGRGASLADVGIDALGASLGFILVWINSRRSFPTIV